MSRIGQTRKQCGTGGDRIERFEHVGWLLVVGRILGASTTTTTTTSGKGRLERSRNTLRIPSQDRGTVVHLSNGRSRA